MNEYDVQEIKTGRFFTEPVYLDEGFVLLAQEMVFSDEIASLLTEWNYQKVLSNGVTREFYENDDANQVVQNDMDKIERARVFIEELEEWTAKFFMKISSNSSAVHFEMVAEKMKQLCDYIKVERRSVLQVPKNDAGADDESFYASHCVWTAIVSIIIGLRLKLPIHRLIELGAAALLHEIGMLKLPPSIYRIKSTLSDKEKGLLFEHPRLGYELLKSYNFPLSVCIPALEHHERENGSGYPRHLSKDKATLYSKIVMVAGSYAAITESRPHRDARSGYEGITDLLRNKSKQYDESVVRALVFSLSIYPIGQYVELSNGRKAQVVDTNPEDPRYPIVQIFKEQTQDGANKIVTTSASGIYIVRPINKDEV
ncbi:MAG: HD-GYP domain-containing protein [Spirochaetaceae bacterium]|jgi:HD-GYP domain-containing protein (c-di-GMP phosphodiesterase class II)|nr:HD-GYP domain-containing protein [Spirochaetaceae bacterium]